ncbi:hypothetical protein CACET_c38850 [Clostridium aceticum]|uniref:Uncharacterized protein n=1 Tax=Clostridium aceticum TaxID=84022 RepID=A0A0D8I8G0_9CLOT|nr:hypothetical protein [Clostridium aceticum]AKL97313.1 hypothetical protein CACET_c38850 [Clostridium aceticum]KJF26329.1 hypothetical protein TZ02_14275 [Clostridium aceticum]
MHYKKSRWTGGEGETLGGSSKDVVAIGFNLDGGDITCAYAFLWGVLRNVDCKVSVVTMPDYWETSENTIAFCGDWGEVAPGQFYRFLSLEWKISIRKDFKESKKVEESREGL